MILDILGRELKIGDEIVFASQGSSELKRRRVIDILDNFGRGQVTLLKEDSGKKGITSFRGGFLIINNLIGQNENKT